MVEVSLHDAYRALLAFAFMAVAAACSVAAVFWRRRISGLLVGLLVGLDALSGLLWLLTDKPFEGRTLWLLSQNHGLTEGDTAVVVPLGAAALVIIAALLSKPRA